ncbi:hypothetical protein [Streptomyces sp. NPDC058953]
MIAPSVHRIAHQVEIEAWRLVPPTKRWITMANNVVCPAHRQAHDQTVPANLRFTVRSMDWDRRHRGVGPCT